MTDSEHESTAAWRELLDTLGGLDRSFLDGERAVTDDRQIADGYRMLATTLGVAFDTYLFGEPSRPMFVEVNTPFRRDRRWGGDNTDAYYYICPVDPGRRYRISGNRGDSVYFSLTAYNEPSPGAWSDRIVAIVRDDDLDIDAAGNFSFELGPTPDAAVLMTRDYQADPLTGRPVSWHIEALDEPEPIRHGDAETAAKLAGKRGLDAHDVRDRAAGRGRASRRGARARPRDRPCSKPIRRPLPSAGRQFRLVGPRRLLFLWQFRARRGRGAGHHPPAAAMPVLESGGVEPVHGHPRRHRCALLDQRPQRGAQCGRHGDDRHLPGNDGTSEFADHA